MSSSMRNLIIPLGQRARAAVWPALARQYRSNPAKVSRFRLKVLGIADLSYRPNFAALANAVDHTRDLQGSIIECGVFRGSTLLGMAHRLTLQGRRDINLIGCDSFEGFPDNQKFRLVHLDCDLYESYMTCLRFLYPRLVRGGYMVFDEYDLAVAAYPGAQKAIDQFLAGKPEKLERFGEGVHTRCYIVKH